MRRSSTLQPLKEQHTAHNRTEEPQQQIDQIDPNRILHPLDTRGHFSVLVNVHLAEDAEERAPEDEEDEVPGRENVGLDEGNCVDDGGDGGEG